MRAFKKKGTKIKQTRRSDSFKD